MKINYLYVFFFCIIWTIGCEKEKPVISTDYCRTLNDTIGKMVYQYEQFSQFTREEIIYMPYSEKLSYVQLPEDYMASLTNEQLFYNCLYWKFNVNLGLFNTYQQGFMSIYRDFNGLRELFERKGIEMLLLDHLLKIHLGDNNMDGPCSLHMLMIQMICAQPQIINKYNEQEIFTILEKYIYIFDEITNNVGEYWAYYSYSPVIRALSTILIKVKYPEFMPFSQTNLFKEYINGKIEINYEIISNVIDCSKEYYNKRKDK